MAKPSSPNVASPQGSKKDPKPFFVKQHHVMPAGSSRACTYKFSRQSAAPPYRLITAPK